MIEHLSGTVVEKSPTKVVISASGVGYAALISLSTYEHLPEVGAQASMYTHLVVREDALTLYGFSSPAERDMFLLLTSITGVGPKSAIGILSGIGADQLKAYIADGAAAALTLLPGVGKKTAERIVLELRDKIGQVGSMSGSSGSTGGLSSIREQATSALIALGYSRIAAERSIRQAQAADGIEANASVEALIKAALRSINT